MAHLAYAALFFLAAQVCIRCNTRLVARMIAAVNQKLPPDQSIPYALDKRSKRKTIEAEYRRLYPRGRLNLWSSVWLGAGLAAFLLTALMFFKPGG